MARQWLVLLAAALVLVIGAAPAAGAGIAPADRAGASHALPDDFRSHPGLLPRAVDRGRAPDRASTDALPAVSVTSSGTSGWVVAESPARRPAHRLSPSALGRAPPPDEDVPSPS